MPCYAVTLPCPAVQLPCRAMPCHDIMTCHAITMPCQARPCHATTMPWHPCLCRQCLFSAPQAPPSQPTAVQDPAGSGAPPNQEKQATTRLKNESPIAVPSHKNVNPIGRKSTDEVIRPINHPGCAGTFPNGSLDWLLPRTLAANASNRLWADDGCSRPGPCRVLGPSGLPPARPALRRPARDPAPALSAADALRGRNTQGSSPLRMWSKALLPPCEGTPRQGPARCCMCSDAAPPQAVQYQY